MPASLRTTASVALVLLVALALPPLRQAVPFLADRPWSTQLALIALPLLALGRASWAALGLDKAPTRGLAVVLGGSLLMPVAFLLAGARPGLPSTADVAQGVVLAAIAEEMVFRGYAFRQLHRRAGWPLVAALLVTALAFGLGHLRGALAAGEDGHVLSTVLVTAAGGAWFAWILSRWAWSLWVPIALHASMNLWWHVFSAGPTAGAGGAAASLGRGASIALITALTLRWTKRPMAPLERASLAA